MLRRGLVFGLLSLLTMTVHAENAACTNATSNLYLAIINESMQQYPNYSACGGYLYPSYLHLIEALPYFDYDDYATATSVVATACDQLYYATQETCADDAVIAGFYQQCLQLQATIPNC